MEVKDIAYDIECKKDGLKQNQDGSIKITFSVHPNDMRSELYQDAMGQRYRMFLVPIDDNEQPRDTATAPNHGVHAVADQAKSSDKPRTLTQQVGMICANSAFAEWAQRKYSNAGPDIADFVRKWCGVTSRRDILPGTQAATRWKQLHDQFWLESRGYV